MPDGRISLRITLLPGKKKSFKTIDTQAPEITRSCFEKFNSLFLLYSELDVRRDTLTAPMEGLQATFLDRIGLNDLKVIPNLQQKYQIESE